MKNGWAADAPEFGKVIVPSVAFCPEAGDATSRHTKPSNNFTFTPHQNPENARNCLWSDDSITVDRIPTDCPGLGRHHGAVPTHEGGARRPSVHTGRRWPAHRPDDGFAT